MRSQDDTCPPPTINRAFPATQSISPGALRHHVGSPSAPVLIDICIDEDFRADPRLIPGAFRHPHPGIETLVPHLAGRQSVVICQKGLKLSQGAAALLRSHGLACTYLAGGIVAWRDQSGPMVPAAAIPARRADGATLWVGVQRPGPEALGQAWLIRRFVDTRARILCVEAGQVADVAQRFGAAPFGLEPDGLAQMLETFGLATPALVRLADVVQATGSGAGAPPPVAAGLGAIARGLAQTHADDLAYLEAGLVVFDGLYRWARDEDR